MIKRARVNGRSEKRSIIRIAMSNDRNRVGDTCCGCEMGVCVCECVRIEGRGNGLNRHATFLQTGFLETRHTPTSNLNPEPAPAGPAAVDALSKSGTRVKNGKWRKRAGKGWAEGGGKRERAGGGLQIETHMAGPWQSPPCFSAHPQAPPATLGTNRGYGTLEAKHSQRSDITATANHRGNAKLSKISPFQKTVNIATCR